MPNGDSLPHMSMAERFDWRLVSFYAGVPAFVGIYGGLNNWEIQQTAGYGVSLMFYLAHSFIPWWITCLSSSFLMWAMNGIKPPPLAIMIPGSLIGCVLTLPYTNWITSLFERAWPSSMLSLGGVPAHPWSGDFLEYMIRATVMWVVVNFVFDRFVGLPRYRYEIPRGYEDPAGTAAEANKTESETAALPAFITRLPVRISVEEVLAIKAEQHYIRIMTPAREHMILYRFSDAISQLDAELGMQVHRSWWVAHAAIDGLQQSAKKLLIVLNSGREVPVSAPYQGMLKELARSKGIPVKPRPRATDDG